jgi:hypothetical protein
MKDGLRVRAFLRNLQRDDRGAALLDFEFLRVECEGNAAELIDDVGKEFVFELVPNRRGVWIEFAEDGKRVVDILHEPKEAEMPDSYVWCEETT